MLPTLRQATHRRGFKLSDLPEDFIHQVGGGRPARRQPTTLSYCEFDMFISVDRLEIIAAIDAEVTRLRHARFLIAQYSVGTPSDHRRSEPPMPVKRRKERSVATGRQVIARAHRERQIQKQEVPVLITRVTAKEAPKQRVTPAATRQKTALTGDVPENPIAVPANRRKETGEGSETSVAHTASAPASAFGLAITRGLASFQA
jgi:hypothetical protein